MTSEVTPLQVPVAGGTPVEVLVAGAKGILPEMTFLILRNLTPELVAGRNVLDVGCGNGVLSFACASLGARAVTGIDVNPLVLGQARGCRANNPNGYRVQFERTPVAGHRTDEPYDLIVCNAAQLPLPEPTDFFGKGAYFAGRDGRNMIRSLLERLADLLAEGGQLLLIQTDLAHPEDTAADLASLGLEHSVTDTTELPLYAHVAARPELLEFLRPRLTFKEGRPYFGFKLWRIGSAQLLNASSSRRRQRSAVENLAR